MSEFERARSAVPPVTPTAGSETILPDDDAGGGAEAPYHREGLPPGFRMRHDAHYVDQLTTRAAAPQVRVIPLRDIDAPRPPADAPDLGALERSIRKLGVLQPLLVRPRAGRFELIAGARRLAAAAAAGLTEVPCLVHAVDDARARALAEAEGLGAPPSGQEPAPSAALADQGLTELSRSFSAIGSCLHLLADRDTALRDRVALDLVRTEVHRATRLVRCLAALGQDPPMAESDVLLASTIAQVIETFGPERRLSGASIAMDAADGHIMLRADADWLAVALSGALGGMLALVHGARTPALTLRLASSGSRASAMLEISQQSVTVPAWALGRFFDPTWTDRPGGYQAAAELAAARRITERHRGGAEALPGERGGCRLVLLYPTA